MKELLLAVTGHRSDKLGGYSTAAKGRLDGFARMFLSTLCPDKVYSGMALGWDISVATAAVDLSIPYISVVPFVGQEKKWPAESQKRYRELMEKAATRVDVCEGGYAAWKMQKRNEFMVDHCHVLGALFNGSPGGTKNCVDYADRKQVPVLSLWNAWEAAAEGRDRQARNLLVEIVCSLNIAV